MTTMNNEVMVNSENSSINSLKDKYLTFNVGNEDYGIEIRHVIEIIGMQDITEVPDMPKYLKGVINLRGKVIPVIDVRLRFLMDAIDYGSRTCIIIIRLDEIDVGLIVDEVSEVLKIDEDNIDLPTKTMKGTKSKFIKGFGKIDEEVKIILDIDRFLNDKEMEDIKVST